MILYYTSLGTQLCLEIKLSIKYSTQSTYILNQAKNIPPGSF